MTSILLIFPAVIEVLVLLLLTYFRDPIPSE